MTDLGGVEMKRGSERVTEKKKKETQAIADSLFCQS